MDWLLKLDPTVQVAVLGPIIAAIIAFPSWLIIHMKPATEKEKIEPREPDNRKPVTIELEETDRLRMDRLMFILNSLSDTLERLRVEIGSRRP